MQLTGTVDHGVTALMEAHLEADGWAIERRPLPGRANGYTHPERRTVALDSGLSAKQEAKTLIHEAAHILLGHTDDMSEYAEHRGLMETEAESVAYIVAGLARFDTSAYSIGYIAGWANADTDLIRSTAARVLKTAHQITTILTPTDHTGDKQAEDGETGIGEEAAG